MLVQCCEPELVPRPRDESHGGATGVSPVQPGGDARLSIGSEDSSGRGRRGEPRLYTKDGRNRLGLNRIDLLIIAAYLAGITLFGLRFRKRQRTMRDYFLADRNIPWWAIALSIVAAETST